MTDVEPPPRIAIWRSEYVEPNVSAFQVAKRPLVILGPSLNTNRASDIANALRKILQAPVVFMESPQGLNDQVLGRLNDVALEADHVLCLGKAVDFTLQFGSAGLWPNANLWDVFSGDERYWAMARKTLGTSLSSAVLISLASHLGMKDSVVHSRADWINDATVGLPAPTF